METNTVQLKAADGHQFDAYIARPAGTSRGLLVVAPEIFGINEHIRGVADGFAADGYLAVAPALFDRVQRSFQAGYTESDVATGVQLMKQMSWENAMLDVDAALVYGKANGKAGIVGYCWGGAVAWLAASRLSNLDASICYYGGAIPSLIDEQPRCPVMLHFGTSDTSIPLDKAEEIARRHPDAQTYYYPAGHGFNCEQRGSYHEEAARQARARTLAFLQENVG